MGILDQILDGFCRFVDFLFPEEREKAPVKEPEPVKETIPSEPYITPMPPRSPYPEPTGKITYRLTGKWECPVEGYCTAEAKGSFLCQYDGFDEKGNQVQRVRRIEYGGCKGY